MSAERNLGTTLTKTKSGVESTDLVVADLTSIGEIGVESEEIDVTTLDSTGGFREFIAGSKDSGEVAISGIIKSESSMETLLALANSQAVEEWTVETDSGSTWVFDAFVKSFKEGEASVDGVRTFSMTLRISGETDYTSVVVSA